MRQNLKDLLKKTHSGITNLRDRVKKIKAEREDNQFEEKMSKFLEKIPKASTEKTVHLSTSSVARATVIIILLITLSFVLFEIRQIILLLFIALLFAAALDPTVDSLAKRNIPRSLSIILIYIFGLAFIAIFISQLIPLVATQLIELASKVGILINNIKTGTVHLPYYETIQPYVSNFLEGIDQQTIIESAKAALLKVGEQLQGVAGNAWRALMIIFNGIFNVVLVLVLTFFLVVDNQAIETFIRSLFSARYEEYIIVKTNMIKIKVGNWLRGQLLLVFAIGTLTFIGLTILDIEYAATLAMIAGLMEIIPVVGPIIASIPALLIAANTSGWTVLWVLILYIIVQQLENNIIVPIVMKKAVGIHPVTVMISMLIGFQFLGIVGIIIAVPVASTISIFIKEYSEKKK